MAHTLLEQTKASTQYGDFLNVFVDVFNFSSTGSTMERYIKLNNNKLYFIFSQYVIMQLNTKTNNAVNVIGYARAASGVIYYHVSEDETVKYFRQIPENEQDDFSYGYIIAQDENGEWVVFNGDKMYSDYGATGIYNNPQIGRAEIVDEENQFLISKAHRLDTGAEFKELYFVLSAKSYSDTNCIVDFGGKTYRLVSVSNTKDETGRYPAFAFPVSD